MHAGCRLLERGRRGSTRASALGVLRGQAPTNSTTGEELCRFDVNGVVGRPMLEDYRGRVAC